MTAFIHRPCELPFCDRRNVAMEGLRESLLLHHTLSITAHRPHSRVLCILVYCARDVNNSLPVMSHRLHATEVSLFVDTMWGIAARDRWRSLRAARAALLRRPLRQRRISSDGEAPGCESALLALNVADREEWSEVYAIGIVTAVDENCPDIVHIECA